MGKPIVGHWDVPYTGQNSALVVVSTFFLMGAIGGYMVATQVHGGSEDGVSLYLAQFLSSLQVDAVISPHMLPLLWGVLRWSLLAVLLRYTVFGVLGVPMLFAVRGFLLSCSISTFVRLYGGMGGMVAFVLFGLSGLLSLPVLFVLGVESFVSASNIPRKVPTECRSISWSRDNLVRIGWCTVTLGVCIGIEAVLVPSLLRGLGEMLSL